MKPAHVRELEEWITAIEKELPAQKSFLLPGGPKPAALLQLARTVCRRAERWVVLLAAEEQLNLSVQIFLNRLSDALFLFARALMIESGTEEIEVSYD
jgi:cob(I)alamin adenosyltransferase